MVSIDNMSGVSNITPYLAAMASVRVFRVLNMVLWLGGTLSAKANQSMAFNAARRPAIFQSVSDKGDKDTWVKIKCHSI